MKARNQISDNEIEIENLNWNLLNKRAEISAGIERPLHMNKPNIRINASDFKIWFVTIDTKASETIFSESF